MGPTRENLVLHPLAAASTTDYIYLWRKTTQVSKVLTPVSGKGTDLRNFAYLSLTPPCDRNFLEKFIYLPKLTAYYVTSVRAVHWFFLKFSVRELKVNNFNHT